MTKLAPIEFDFENDTKNTYRFKEKAEEGEEIIGRLYIQKSAFKGVPKGVKVTVDIVE